jgi:hypothetical protein
VWPYAYEWRCGSKTLQHMSSWFCTTNLPSATIPYGVRVSGARTLQLVLAAHYVALHDIILSAFVTPADLRARRTFSFKSRSTPDARDTPRLEYARMGLSDRLKRISRHCGEASQARRWAWRGTCQVAFSYNT